MAEEIVNKVQKSGLITLDLKNFYTEGERVHYDIKENLFQGMILREKDFRDFVKTHDWSQYQDKYVAVFCSEEAIIPMWAYMLFVSQCAPYAKKVIVGTPEQLEQSIFEDNLHHFDPTVYQDARIVIKGCGDKPIPPYAYGELTRLLQPVVKNLMFGEPCSTVPVYKKPRKQ